MEVQLRKNKEDWVASYLTIWQGFMGITERELEVLTLIALRYLELKESITNEDLIAELLLSTPTRASLRRSLSINGEPLSGNGLQNYIASLQKKGALVPLAGKHTLNPRLIPQEHITFNFTIL